MHFNSLLNEGGLNLVQYVLKQLLHLEICLLVIIKKR